MKQRKRKRKALLPNPDRITVDQKLPKRSSYSRDDLIASVDPCHSHSQWTNTVFGKKQKNKKSDQYAQCE